MEREAAVSFNNSVNLKAEKRKNKILLILGSLHEKKTRSSIMDDGRGTGEKCQL
jgi:hypothetical protein